MWILMKTTNNKTTVPLWKFAAGRYSLSQKYSLFIFDGQSECASILIRVEEDTSGSGSHPIFVLEWIAWWIVHVHIARSVIIRSCRRTSIRVHVCLELIGRDKEFTGQLVDCNGRRIVGTFDFPVCDLAGSCVVNLIIGIFGGHGIWLIHKVKLACAITGKCGFGDLLSLQVRINGLEHSGCCAVIYAAEKEKSVAVAEELIRI